ncbi:MAG: PTS system mannose/fructose/sorbose family transporter subunit IID, partial [Collinsella intestinalis]|nr:PTS system mannose/fructose/sorbose family transporter subunit IID [Collinsella intestinalis]
MASNEFVVPAQYEDLTPAPNVDKKTLNRMVWRSYWLQSSFNYETMQSGGWLFAMVPGLEKVHTNKNDLSASMYHNLDFINTHPFLVTFVMGIVLSLEQNKVDTQTIRSVRISAASPLGGIGDALFWLTLVPITAGITSNMAIEGNIIAPLIFLVVFHAALFACRFGLMNWAYKMGTSAIDSLTSNMQAFTRAAAIMGCFVVGALTVNMGGTQINLN